MRKLILISLLFNISNANNLEQDLIQNNIHMQIGENKVLNIAINNVNNINIPFKDMIVDTMNHAQIKIYENNLVIATDNTDPISISIRDSNNYNNHALLTLIPKYIPSQNYNINIGNISNNAINILKLDSSSQIISKLIKIIHNNNLAIKYKLINTKINSNQTNKHINYTKNISCINNKNVKYYHIAAWNINNYLVEKINIINESNISFIIEANKCAPKDAIAMATTLNNQLPKNSTSEIIIIKRFTKN